MRFTFVILLFCSLGADAQMIIKAHANYRPLAQTVVNLLLDDYPNAAAAYSLRKLRTAYTGSAIRVRRSNDNTEQDIGFTASGDLDTASLKTFVGANNGFVTTWYNQSGLTGYNASNATAANQPSIIASGVIYRINGEPSIYFDGGDNLQITGLALFNYLHLAGESFCSFVFQLSAGGQLFSNSRNSNEAGMQFILSTGITHNVFGQSQRTPVQNIASAGYLSLNVQYYISLYTNVTASAAQRSTIEKNNGNAVNNNTQTDAASTSTNASRNMQIGMAGNGGSWITGYVSEIITWNSGQQSNKTGIANNINSYYGIY